MSLSRLLSKVKKRVEHGVTPAAAFPSSITSSLPPARSHQRGGPSPVASQDEFRVVPRAAAEDCKPTEKASVPDRLHKKALGPDLRGNAIHTVGLKQQRGSAQSEMAVYLGFKPRAHFGP